MGSYKLFFLLSDFGEQVQHLLIHLRCWILSWCFRVKSTTVEAVRGTLWTTLPICQLSSSLSGASEFTALPTTFPWTQFKPKIKWRWCVSSGLLCTLKTDELSAFTYSSSSTKLFVWQLCCWICSTGGNEWVTGPSGALLSKLSKYSLWLSPPVTPTHVLLV